MEKQFKFRHANELAGGFVVLVFALCLTGIFVAGHRQGWFEGKFVLKVRFVDADGSISEEGSFGLREGNEVRIMNTLAGRVGKIIPVEKGYIETTLIIRNSFKQYVRKDSTAKVKKMFGVAGDSHLSVEGGKGAPIAEGELLICVKDEEVMDKAKKMMAKVEEVVVPMLEQVQRILEHLNHITGQIEDGAGIAGSVVNDKQLDRDVKDTVKNLNGVMLETQSTLLETRRLVKGMQKHWIVRRYIEEGKEAELLLPAAVYRSNMSAQFRNSSLSLDIARSADDSRRIGRSAYNLAVCMLAEDEECKAIEFLKEARAEFEASGENIACLLLVEAEIEHRKGEADNAITMVQSSLKLMGRSFDRQFKLNGLILLGHLLCDTGRIEDCRAQLKTINSLARKVESFQLKAMASGISGRVLLLEKEPAEAAKQFDDETRSFREAELYRNMALALRSAGDAYVKAGQYDTAADRYFRAGRTLFSNGDKGTADVVMKYAIDASERGKNEALKARINRLKAEIQGSDSI
ncbi:MlaD family protein [Verrucomicrobiota bacterium]